MLCVVLMPDPNSRCVKAWEDDSLSQIPLTKKLVVPSSESSNNNAALTLNNETKFVSNQQRCIWETLRNEIDLLGLSERKRQLSRSARSRKGGGNNSWVLPAQ